MKSGILPNLSSDFVPYFYSPNPEAMKLFTPSYDGSSKPQLSFSSYLASISPNVNEFAPFSFFISMVAKKN